MSPRVSIRLLAAQSDERLLALVHQGHERAFEALVQRYRRPLLIYCRHTMGLSDAGAEDVLQHALLQAWLALRRGVEVRDLKPWLYRIVHNAAVNSMRGRSEGDCELSDATDAETLTAREAELDGKIAMREALSGVAALPEKQRQAMFLTAVGGQSHDEVASALGISDGAVRGLLYRARATLRTAAAAITPQPLIEWASGGAGTSVPTAERVAELSSAGGAFGATGLLIKGAVVAVTAGALATGAAAVHLHQHNARRSAGRAPSAQVTRSAAMDESAATHVESTSSPPRAATVTRSPGTLGRAGDGARRSGRRFAAAGAAPAGRRLSEDRSHGVASNGRHDNAHGGAGRNADSTGGEGGDRSPGSPSHDGKHSEGVNTEGSGSVPAGSHADGRSVQSPPGDGSGGESAGRDAHGEPGQAITADEHSGKRSASGSDG